MGSKMQQQRQQLLLRLLLLGIYRNRTDLEEQEKGPLMKRSQRSYLLRPLEQTLVQVEATRQTLCSTVNSELDLGLGRLME